MFHVDYSYLFYLPITLTLSLTPLVKWIIQWTSCTGGCWSFLWGLHLPGSDVG